MAAENGIDADAFEIFDNTDERAVDTLADAYCSQSELFSRKAVVRKSKDTLRCAMFLLVTGHVDCVAAGKERSTGDVVFEASAIVGLAEGVETPSSLGIAEIPGFSDVGGITLGLADCAITAQPDAEELAGIAISSADTVATLLGWEPRVAMLSFSTCGSAEHESLDVVRKAVSLVHERRPDVKCDGELQLDAAIIPQVAASKVPRESEVAGRANVLVFPNLHAGNIGVKLIQIFGHAHAYGPVLQGFASPVCDFSRSAPVEEMLGNVAMLAIRAAATKGAL
ncbi:phosphate acyltransferase [Eggerthella sinensis]|uniref:phosphate acyltransferase n=1 Tax=Eggerthella sinensis TaxID=242230 RepID=UPI002FD84D69